jgi:protein involved in polysaccharide export with SLBB domain
LAPTLLLPFLYGCAALPPNSFLDPTKVGRFGLDAREVGIRRILSPRETPPGIPNATDPTPDDLVPVYADYRMGPGDTIAFTINDLLSPGQPYSAQVEISPLGEIRIPDLGTVRVAGLTEQEFEQEIAARLREAGLLPRPVVVVFPQVRRGRMVSVMGALRQPGVYPITEPDMRLLDVIGMAGDIEPNARRGYVIRRHAAPAAVPLSEPAPAEDGLVIPPPIEEEVHPAVLAASTAGYASRPGPTEPPPTREELSDVLAPPAQTRPATDAAVPAEAAFQPIVFDPVTGQVIDTQPTEQAEAPRLEELPALAPEDVEAPFDWDDVPELGLEQRVIAIDLTALKAGDPRYNIVMRERDVVNVPVDIGVFYLMGEVNRPGVYAFGGREISVKQAMAIAGGFSALAWPQRAELIRREPGTDKQITRPINLDAIFAGLEDDFYLRDDDVLNVGTHLVAPFLYVIRNSFRFTYGFGFVYDRNFADQDAYNARANPETVDQLRRQQRGLPF